MWTPRWLLALPLALASTLAPAHAAAVRDRAGLFTEDAVRQAEAELSRIESATQLPVTIETVPSLDGQSVADVTREHARNSGRTGVYVLIAKGEGKIYVLSSRSYTEAINAPRRQAIESAFISELKKRDFDAALLRGVKAIGSEASAAKAELGTLSQGNAPARRGAGGAAGPFGRPANPRPGGGFGVGSLLMLGLVVIGVLFFIRLLGSMFGGARGYAGQPGRMGGPGYGPGYGGGGGGGFMSSLFGGIGGAMAGNWLYDQFGRNHGSTYDQGSTAGGAPAPGDEWSGGAGTGGDWGGGDAGGGGGDWGGGGGGGGDWGGGGDGGGGGDW